MTNDDNQLAGNITLGSFLTFSKAKLNSFQRPSGDFGVIARLPTHAADSCSHCQLICTYIENTFLATYIAQPKVMTNTNVQTERSCTTVFLQYMMES